MHCQFVMKTLYLFYYSSITITHLFKCKCITQLPIYSMTHLFRCKCIPPTNISYKTFYTIQGVPKKIGFRKVAQFSPRGV